MTKYLNRLGFCSDLNGNRGRYDFYEIAACGNEYNNMNIPTA